MSYNSLPKVGLVAHSVSLSKSVAFYAPKVHGCYIGSFFTFFNFYQLDVHIKTHVAFANLRRNIFKNRIENRISCDLVTVIESACLLIP